VSTDHDTMSIPLRRSTLALSISLLAGGLLAPTSAPARKLGRRTCSVSLEASAAVVTAGEPVTLLGQMVCPGATGAAGESLTVYQRERGSGQSELATVTTGEDGSYQLTTGPLTSKSVFVVRSLLAHSVRTVVRVTPKVTLDGPAADGAELATRGDRADGLGRFTFSGTVSPARPGMLVALQREYLASGERWHTIALGRLDDEGQYSISHGFRSTGEVSIRVVVHPPGELAIASEPLSYDISQTQAPQLTIQASADPISPGQSATIAGVAAGAAGQTLTLLARTHGQPFAPIAKATTEVGGAYNFTVTPLQNTTYRVLSASAESSELFEGVRYALSAEAPASTVQTGVPLTFSGTVLGAPAGALVYLERRNASGIGFHVVDSGAVGSGDSYSIAHTFDSAGSELMRITVPAGPQTLGSTSPEFTITVTRGPGAPAS
jgi:hypothetical protein